PVATLKHCVRVSTSQALIVPSEAPEKKYCSEELNSKPITPPAWDCLSVSCCATLRSHNFRSPVESAETSRQSFETKSKDLILETWLLEVKMSLEVSTSHTEIDPSA